MKIVCASCETSYEIDDGKVTGSGRVFRIACRSCDAAILIDGLEGEGESRGVWYASEGGARQGPMTLAALREIVEDAAPEARILVWRGGMDRWRPASEVDALEVVTEAATLQTDHESGDPDQTTMISLDEIERVHAELDAMDAPVIADEQLEEIPDETPPDLPADAVEPESKEDEDGDEDGDEAADFDDASDDELGSTLIFKVASGAAAPGPELPEASSVIPSSDTGDDVPEVSRSAAELFRLDDLELGNASSRSSSVGRGVVGVTSTSLFVGDVPTTGDTGPRTRRMATSTMTVPIVRKRGLPGRALALAAVVALGAVAAYVATRPDEPTPVVADPVAQAPAPAAAPAKVDTPAPPQSSAPAAPKAPVAEAPPPAPAAPEAPGTPPEGKPAAAPAEAAPAPSTPAKAALTRSEKKRAKRKKTAKAARAAKARASASGSLAAPRASKLLPAPAAAKASKKRSSSSNDVNALLGQLKAKPKESGGSSDADLPSKLSASAVRGTLRKRQSRFKSCYRKMENRPAGAVTVKTSFVIAGTGRVQSARISSAGGVDSAVQSCILGVIKGAKFPRFRDAQMIVNYPILLR